MIEDIAIGIEIEIEIETAGIGVVGIGAVIVGLTVAKANFQVLKVYKLIKFLC